MGRVASIDRPRIPMVAEYNEYKEGNGERKSSKTVKPMKRYRRNCQYGLGDLHCQKLYGRTPPGSPSRAPANGTADSPPFDDGAGR